MISLRRATRDELLHFDAMDRQTHAVRFVTQCGIEMHRQYFDNPDITYLSIDNGDGECLGYFVLVLEADRENLEFRRILIDRNCRGAGQTAILAMEAFCQREFDIKRIWLDVYDDNAIGIHIYEKLGYRRFRSAPDAGRKLHFYEKFFRPPI